MRLFTFIILCMSLTGCSNSTPVPPPGHSGPVPTPAAQKMLNSIQGHTYDDTAGTFGGGTWTVGPFGVVPNPVTSKGPVVYLEKPGAEDIVIPVENDADVADFHRMITGEPKVDLGSDMLSANYRRAVGK